MSQTLSNNLVLRRLDTGISREALASALGVSVSTLHMWECGRYEPVGIYRERILNLMPGADKEFPSHSTEYLRTELNGLLRKLDRKQLTAVGDWVRITYADTLYPRSKA